MTGLSFAQLVLKRSIGLFNLKKAPVRAKIASAWIDQKIHQSGLAGKPSLATDLDRASLDFQSWRAAASAHPRLFTSAGVVHLGRYVEKDPARSASCLRDADAILGHRFEMLGSGVYNARCPVRPAPATGYQPIDWYSDPVRKLRFPHKVPYKEWSLFRDRPENADIKYPWELARCQHFFTLAQAWKLTREPRYAREIIAEIADFDEDNPVGFGVNWTCTMDVGLRAANWAVALDLISDCDDIPEEDFFSAYSSLFAHGLFIRGNLENTYEVTSNHFLSNIVGLHFIAAIFSDLPQGEVWNDFCRGCLETEIDVQILPDGADFESSIPYHRLVAELFLGSYRVAQHQGAPLSDHYASRLSAMIDYLVGVLCPNGSIPVFGDADDGRLMIATDYFGWARDDARHILAPAALTLGKFDWLTPAPPYSDWEALWWGFDGASYIPPNQPPPDNVALYPEAGVAVSRTAIGGHYLLACNSIVGTKGFGNHKHNDQLSFEYHDQGVPLIVDPGSYVYTSDFAARNMFRCTAYHNTVQIDGVEQNEFNPEWLFRMFEKANAKHDLFEDTGSVTVYEGSHTGYAEQLTEPVTHRRRFEHDRSSGRLTIKDRFPGEGSHRLVWHFHLAPGVSIEDDSTGGAVRLSAGGKAWRLSWDTPVTLSVAIEDGWVSRSYGVRTQAKVLRVTAEGVAAGDTPWTFEIQSVTA